jgi:hypothetical protein
MSECIRTGQYCNGVQYQTAYTHTMDISRVVTNMQWQVLDVYDRCLLGDLSKPIFFCTRIVSAWFQKVGKILMSHLLSPVLSFEIHAEPMLKPCAEGKNMAKSTWKRPFHAGNMSSNIFARMDFSCGSLNFVRMFLHIVPEQSGDHGVPKSWYNTV